MSFALNEIEATAKKATRGAGYPWGLAEEAAKATRWLCAQGLDGASVLAAVLEGGAGAACALTQGTGLSDRAAHVADRGVTFGTVERPIMILPFAAMVARQTGRIVTVACGDVVAVTDGAKLSLTGAFPDRADTVTIRVGGALGDNMPAATRATPDPGAWEALNRLAARTYAPATEESRLLGAGAGTTDND